MSDNYQAILRQEATTQAEFDAILAAGDIAIVRTGYWLVSGSAHVEARGSAHVVVWDFAHVEACESAHVAAYGSARIKAWDSAYIEAYGFAHVVAYEFARVVASESTHVVAYGSARVEACGSAHVVARGSAHVEARGSAHVVAYGSAHIKAWNSAYIKAYGFAHVVAYGFTRIVASESTHVVAYGSARVEACGSAHVVARGSAYVKATKYVSCVINYDHEGTVVGGIQIRPDYSTLAAWLEYHGVAITDGTVVLYKAVRDDYRSARGFLYQPGTQVEAPDWDGEARECGGGLHLSPCPEMAKSFDSNATRILAVTVMVTDLALGPVPLEYITKIKARRIVEIKEVEF